MRSVFISYEKHDAVIANDLCAYLENNGHACWIAPRDIVAGEDYAGEIIRAVKNSCSLIVVCSGFTKNSGHVLNEVSIAFDRKIQIIPYCTDDSELGDSLDYYLAAIHRIITSGDRASDFAAVLRTLETGTSLSVRQEPPRKIKRSVIVAAFAAICIAATVGIAAGKLHKSGSEASSVPAPADETVQIQEAQVEIKTPETAVQELAQKALQAQEPVREEPSLTASSATEAIEEINDEAPALKIETFAAEPEPQEARPQEAIPQKAERLEEVAPDSKPLSLRESLTSAKNLSDLEGIAEYYHVTINTSSGTLAESYLLICSQDGQIQFALSPQDASGLRVNLRTGEKVERIDYSKGNRVEYVKP